MNVNIVILAGHLTRDPQSKALPSGSSVCEFGLATSERYKTKDGDSRESTAFVDCSAFGKTSDNIAKYFKKGSPIFVEGRLKYDTWEDKNGGGKRSKLSVVVDDFKFVGKKESGGDQEDNSDIPF